MIIFDLDGTLVDTRDFVIKSINDLSLPFNYKRLEEVDVRRLRGTRSLYFLKVIGLPIWKGPKLIKSVQKKLSTEIANLPLVPGMKDALLNLKNSGYILGVATSNSPKNVRLFFEKYKDRFFDFKQANIFAFGKHRALRRIGREQEVNLKNIYYVGDETRDVIAAKKAGVNVIAVTWGFNNRKILATLNPDCIADSPEDIVVFLQSQS